MADSAGTGGALKYPSAFYTHKLVIAAAGIAFYCTIGTTGVLARDGSTAIKASATEPETLLLNSLREIGDSRMDSALSEIEALLKANPNFRLAQLIKGDILLARTRAINNVGNVTGAVPEHIADLREEARARVQRHREPIPREMVPKYLLQMQPNQKYAVIADTGKSRLYMYQNVGGEARYLADYYISSGKNGSQKLKEGDQKTPIGVYFVTANLPRKKLTDFYGSGAFPISYPNEWDKRQGRDGFGIWLHGTPSDTYSRPPRASNGCVVLANQDLDTVATSLQVGLTPVIISGEMEWVKPDEVAALRNELAQHLENWRHNWESRNVDTYLAHYGKTFSSGGQDLAGWSQHKYQVNTAKSWIKVGISNVGMFLYPGRDDLAVINFMQDYSSNNLSNKMKKRQYWMKDKEQGRWKIIYEGAA